MPEPFNYVLNVPPPDFGKNFLQGMAIGDASLKREEDAKAKAAIAQRNQMMQQDIYKLTSKPSVSGIRNLMMQYPELADKFKEPLANMTEEQKATRIRQANDVFMPMMAGNRELGLKNLKTYEEAAKNSGDAENARSLGMLRELVESKESGKAGDNTVAVATGTALAAALGDKDFAKAYETVSKVQQEEAKSQQESAEAPFKLSKAKADALIAQNKAEMGEDKQTLNTETGIYERKGNEWVSTGLKPFKHPGVQVSLNQGQKGFENETVLRKEFNAEAKPFNEISSQFGRLKEAAKDNTGASDIAVIYSYMKMLDPGSVVREGEFATAENAGGVGEKVINAYNKIVKGGRLTPEVRADYLNVAKRINTESRVKFNKLKSRYKGISERAGLNPENTVTLEEPTETTGPSVGAVEDGYRYKGGNPANPSSWEKI